MFGVHLDDNDKTSHRNTSGGLWLLRPVPNDEFKVLACLSWVPSERRPLYNHWKWQPEHPDVQTSRYRRLSQALGETVVDYMPPY
jgi:hypothetical protein